MAQDVVGRASADSQMESFARDENIFAEKGRGKAPRPKFKGGRNAQATIWAAWVKVAKAPGTKAVRASIKQLNRINIGGAPCFAA